MPYGTNIGGFLTGEEDALQISPAYRRVQSSAGVLGLKFEVQPWYCGDRRVGEGEKRAADSGN